MLCSPNFTDNLNVRGKTILIIFRHPPSQFFFFLPVLVLNMKITVDLGEGGRWETSPIHNVTVGSDPGIVCSQQKTNSRLKKQLGNSVANEASLA
jgi:hypothetical protein